MAQWGKKANNPEVPGSTPGSYYVSLVFINNLKNVKSKHQKKILLFVLYCLRPLTVIYNMYMSMTSWGGPFLPAFIICVIQ